MTLSRRFSSFGLEFDDEFAGRGLWDGVLIGPMKALIVSLEEESRRLLLPGFQAADIPFFDAPDPAQALAALSQDLFDLLFVIERTDSLGTVAALSRAAPGVDLIVLSSAPSIDGAVAAIRAGARDYLPLALFPNRLPALVRDLRSRISPRDIALQTNVPNLRRALDTAFRAANTDAPILIRGESGVGKSLLARAIHGTSRRSGAPFVVLQCPTVVPGLLRRQLTGQDAREEGLAGPAGGRLVAAPGGTLVLDDVAELPPATQAELLGIMAAEPNGKLPARLIATTKQDLTQAALPFREDLRSRLNVVEVVLPPLRDRPGDILPLADHYLRAYAERYRISVAAFSDEAKECLRNYSWPGNLRELSNTVERIVAVGSGAVVALEDLPPNLTSGPSGPSVELGGEFSLDQIEAEHIRRVLKRSPTIERASNLLGVDQSTLWRKRKRLNL
jgi:NtrC-family two-component system response regulator AlgB